jgi:hypothetical protein
VNSKNLRGKIEREINIAKNSGCFVFIQDKHIWLILNEFRWYQYTTGMNICTFPCEKWANKVREKKTKSINIHKDSTLSFLPYYATFVQKKGGFSKVVLGLRNQDLD